MNIWPTIIQNSLLPPTCILCGLPGKEGLDLCGSCLAHLPRIEHACLLCGIPLTLDTQEVCGPCSKRAPATDSTFTLFHYVDPIRNLIHELKFGDHYCIARLFAYLLAEKSQAIRPAPEAILPVPLHWERYVRRGYNQSVEIARELSRLLNVALVTKPCKRVRNTHPQSNLTANERRKNLKNAFHIVEQLNFRHVVILDDVVTTASTVNEFARTLKCSGITRVDVLAVARA